jgi:ribosome-associated protein
METLIDTPVMELKKLGFPPSCVEGRATGWIVADFSDVLLHVFDEATRQRYNLEDLWKEAPRVDWEHFDLNSLHAVSR